MKYSSQLSIKFDDLGLHFAEISPNGVYYAVFGSPCRYRLLHALLLFSGALLSRYYLTSSGSVTIRTRILPRYSCCNFTEI